MFAVVVNPCGLFNYKAERRRYTIFCQISLWVRYWIAVNLRRRAYAASVEGSGDLFGGAAAILCGRIRIGDLYQRRAGGEYR
jgi:hypothetical protein